VFFQTSGSSGLCSDGRAILLSGIDHGPDHVRVDRRSAFGGDICPEFHRWCDKTVSLTGDRLYKTRFSGSSFKTWRIFRIAALMPLSVSRKTSLPQIRSMISSLVTSSPLRSTSKSSSSMGIRSSLRRRPERRSSYARGSSSRSPPSLTTSESIRTTPAGEGTILLRSRCPTINLSGGAGYEFSRTSDNLHGLAIAGKRPPQHNAAQLLTKRRAT
jgi:hypothetical protein